MAEPGKTNVEEIDRRMSAKTPNGPGEEQAPKDGSELQRERPQERTEDQDRLYYYDDAHGYRDYDPDSEDDEA